jgi:hypothetical protein
MDFHFNYKVPCKKKDNPKKILKKKKTCKKQGLHDGLQAVSWTPSTFKMSRLACHWKCFASSFFVLSLEGARVSNFKENKTTRFRDHK